MGAMECSSSEGRAGSSLEGKDSKIERGRCQPFVLGLNLLKDLGYVRLANNQ